MTGKIFAAVAMIAIGAPTSIQAAKAPLALKHSSAWNVDYADDRCRLARQFGEGDDRVFAIFDRYGPGEHFRLTVAGKPVRSPVGKGEVTIRFGPGGASRNCRSIPARLASFRR